MKLKKSLIIGISVLTLVSITSTVIDSENISADEVQQGSAVTPIEVPMLSEGETFSEEVVTTDGQIGTMEVTLDEEYQEDVANNITTQASIRWHTRSNVKNGVYNVNFILGVTNAGFKVQIKNKNIVRAYDPWRYNLVGSTGVLKKDNSKQATYQMDFNGSIPWVSGPSWTGMVRAKIEGNNLVTYVW